jgi:Fur family ferric uptake transcriptional regulator
VEENMLKDIHESKTYRRTDMQKEIIWNRLREKGCRITNQRRLIIDIIMENNCSCCKEIYYKATAIDNSIGIATVYRFVNTLEEIGAISRKIMYKISYPANCTMENACTVVLDDDTSFDLSAKTWNAVLKAGLNAYGYLNGRNITSVSIKECCDLCET